MKKALIIIIFILSVLHSLNAQWYSRTCGVTDINNCTPAEFDCLWNQASKMAKGGAIATGVGTSLVVVGVIYTFASGFGESAHAALALSMAGVLLDIFMAPVWVTGAVRKSRLRKLPHYEAFNFKSLNISPSLNRNQFNHTYSVGLTASLRF